jgi:hypothetical protein
MLVLEVALGIVLAVFVIAYLGELIAILLFGFGATLLIALFLLSILLLYSIYEGLSISNLLAFVIFIGALVLVFSWKSKSERIKCNLELEIKNRKDMGYDTSELDAQLKNIEADALEAAAMSEAIRVSRIKVSRRRLEKEINRRKALGYDK